MSSALIRSMMRQFSDEARVDKALLSDTEREDHFEDEMSDEDCYEYKLGKRMHTCWLISCIAMATAILALAGWGLLDIFQRSSHSVLSTFTAVEDPCEVCGNTPQEAISRGCKFDYLRTGWLPPFCIDEELNDEFRMANPANGTWEYFADSKGTVSIPADIVPRIWDKPLYTTYGHHFMHCVYTWRKEYRSFTMGKSVLDGVSGEKHIMHCADIFMAKSDFDFGDIVTVIEPKEDNRT